MLGEENAHQSFPLQILGQSHHALAVKPKTKHLAGQSAVSLIPSSPATA